MPVYEYRCRTCDDVFEVRRPMSESSEPATCPDGHPGAVRLLSVFASVGVLVLRRVSLRGSALDGLRRRVRLLPGLGATGRAQRSP